MKTFKQHITEDGKMVGTATSNAVEDGNLGAHNISDPEVLNSRIVKEDSRKELTKPDRHVRIKEISQEIIDLIDRPVEVKDDWRFNIRTWM